MNSKVNGSAERGFETDDCAKRELEIDDCAEHDALRFHLRNENTLSTWNWVVGCQFNEAKDKVGAADQ
jgi:hypothetical protein